MSAAGAADGRGRGVTDGNKKEDFLAEGDPQIINKPPAEKVGGFVIQGVIGYRRHTHAGDHFGKWRFHYDSYFDAYLCPAKEPL